MSKYNQPIHCYVAIQDGKFRGGTCPANQPGLKIVWEDDMEDWWKDMIMDGCAIVTIYSNQEYQDLIKELEQ